MSAAEAGAGGPRRAALVILDGWGMAPPDRATPSLSPRPRSGTLCGRNIPIPCWTPAVKPLDSRRE